jgi:hypothetical protein
MGDIDLRQALVRLQGLLDPVGKRMILRHCDGCVDEESLGGRSNEGA